MRGNCHDSPAPAAGGGLTRWVSGTWVTIPGMAPPSNTPESLRSAAAGVAVTDAGWAAWRVVAALGVTQIISWGSLYYAFAVVMDGVRNDLGASYPVVVGAYSVAILVSGFAAAPVGRHIDRHGARVPMTVGSLSAAVLLAAFSQVASVPALYLVWAGIGCAMALVLYEPAFASLALVFRANLRRAITGLTLVAGFASTVFWPLTQWLDTQWGWRNAMVVLAALNLVVCVPLHFWVLPPRGRGEASPGAASDPAGRARLLRDPRFRWIAAAFTLNMLAQASLSVHLLAILQEKGFSAAAAAWLAALVGPMQVASRVVELAVASRVRAVQVAALAMLASPVAMAVLLVAGGDASWVVVFVMLYGASCGVMTIVRGTVPAEIWGRDGYGALAGLMATPVILMRAVAPSVAAAFLAASGSYAAVEWMLLAASLMSAAAFLYATRR